MFKKRSKPQSAGFIDEVGEKLHLVGDAVREGSAHALEVSGPYLERANEWVGEASEAAAPRLRDASARLNQVAESVRPQVEGALSEVRERFSEGRSKLEEGFRSQVAPALESGTAEAKVRARAAAERAGDSVSKAAGLLAAAETSKGFDDAITRLTGDKKAVKKARKALKKAGRDVKAKTSTDSGRSGGKWFWIILGLAGLGGIVFYAVRRLAPVEDPWSTPLQGNRPEDARPVGSTPRSEQVGPVSSVTSEVPAPEESAVEDDEDPEGTEGAGTNR